MWPIVVTEEGMRKIREIHTGSGRVSGGKSTFHDAEDLERLIDAARDVRPVVQANGKLQGVVASDHEVGYDIEEETGDAGVGEVGRNADSHGARAENCDFVYSLHGRRISRKGGGAKLVCWLCCRGGRRTSRLMRPLAGDAGYRENSLRVRCSMRVIRGPSTSLRMTGGIRWRGFGGFVFL